MSRSRRVALAPPRLAQRFAHYRELSIVYEGTSLDIPVRAPDISTHGMFINTAQKFPEGAVLRICFRCRARIAGDGARRSPLLPRREWASAWNSSDCRKRPSEPSRKRQPGDSKLAAEASTEP